MKKEASCRQPSLPLNASIRGASKARIVASPSLQYPPPWRKKESTNLPAPPHPFVYPIWKGSAARTRGILEGRGEFHSKLGPEWNTDRVDVKREIKSWIFRRKEKEKIYINKRERKRQRVYIIKRLIKPPWSSIIVVILFHLSKHDNVLHTTSPGNYWSMPLVQTVTPCTTCLNMTAVRYTRLPV